MGVIHLNKPRVVERDTPKPKKEKEIKKTKKLK